ADRPTQRAAKLILLEGGRSAGRIEKIPGIELPVPEELVSRAVKAIGAALGHDIDLAVAREAELGGIGGGLHLEFLDSVEIRPDDDAAVEAAGIRCAIHQVVVEVPAPAIHAEPVSQQPSVA